MCAVVPLLLFVISMNARTWSRYFIIERKGQGAWCVIVAWSHQHVPWYRRAKFQGPDTDTEINEKYNRQLHGCLDNIESFDEIYNHRCLNWCVKLKQNQWTTSWNSLVLGAITVVIFAAASWKYSLNLPWPAWKSQIWWHEPHSW